MNIGTAIVNTFGKLSPDHFNGLQDPTAGPEAVIALLKRFKVECESAVTSPRERADTIRRETANSILCTLMRTDEYDHSVSYHDAAQMAVEQADALLLHLVNTSNPIAP